MQKEGKVRQFWGVRIKGWSSPELVTKHIGLFLSAQECKNHCKATMSSFAAANYILFFDEDDLKVWERIYRGITSDLKRKVELFPWQKESIEMLTRKVKEPAKRGKVPKAVIKEAVSKAKMARKVLDMMTFADFEKWYQTYFLDYISGEEDAKPEKDILSDLIKLMR